MTCLNTEAQPMLRLAAQCCYYSVLLTWMVVWFSADGTGGLFSQSSAGIAQKRAGQGQLVIWRRQTAWRRTRCLVITDMERQQYVHACTLDHGPCEIGRRCT